MVVKSKKISLIILVYNRADVIERVIRDFNNQVIKKLPGSEFIIAEDGSTDGTKEILDKLKKELPIKLVQGKERKGYLKAFKDGLKLPKNDIIFQSDADGEHDPRDFWKLFKKIDDFDVVVGYKTKRKPFYRLAISRLNNFLIGLLFGLWLKDANCGFRLIRKRVIKEIISDVNVLKYAPNAEVTIRAKKKGYKIGQVPVKHILTDSEALPLKKMPKVIFEEFFNLFKLRKALK